jgi:hypothetical protein
LNAELTILGMVVMVPFLLLSKSGWRAMFLLVIPVGFMQDPIRKIVAGQPVTAQLAAVVVFGIALLAAMNRYGKPTLSPLAGKSNRSRQLLQAFIAFIAIQGLHSFISFGSLLVPMIGLLSYLLPIPALWVAHQFVRSPEDIRRFLMLYIVIAITLTLGVIANYKGVQSALFAQVGDAPMVVYHQAVGVVDLYCGYLRSPEVAAWHAAALCCAAITLAYSFNNPILRALSPVMVLYALMTIVLTGRRKALVIVVIYMALYLLGIILSKRRSGKGAALAAIAIGGLLVGGAVTMAPEGKAPSPYFERSATTFDDAYDRFEQLGLNTVIYAYNSAGLFGLGAGAGAQGTQYVAGVTTQYSAEGGLGRITVELGPLGLILAVLCAIAVARQARRCVLLAADHDQKLFRLSLGIVSFIGANVPIFIGAAQIFGDPFVLIVLGSQLGFVLSVPRVIRFNNERLTRFEQMHLQQHNQIATHAGTS